MEKHSQIAISKRYLMNYEVAHIKQAIEDV